MKFMTHLRVGALCLAVFCALSSAHLGVAAERPASDGYWWESLKVLERLVFVAGYTQATSRWSAFLKGSIFVNVSPSEGQALSKYTKWLADHMDFGRVSVRQVTDGVDRFYADFRNKGIDIDDAMDIVRQQLQGVSDAEIEKQILKMRISVTHAKED